MELVASRRLNLKPLLTHEYDLDHITDAYDVFGNRKDAVLKVAIRPKLSWQAVCGAVTGESFHR
jgi:alcohol dehydrogenase